MDDRATKHIDGPGLSLWYEYFQNVDIEAGMPG